MFTVDTVVDQATKNTKTVLAISQMKMYVLA